jgi:hypothetical protein
MLPDDNNWALLAPLVISYLTTLLYGVPPPPPPPDWSTHSVS